MVGPLEKGCFFTSDWGRTSGMGKGGDACRLDPTHLDRLDTSNQFGTSVDHDSVLGCCSVERT